MRCPLDASSSFTSGSRASGTEVGDRRGSRRGLSPLIQRKSLLQRGDLALEVADGGGQGLDELCQVCCGWLGHG
jgi:hypothetical protein